MLTLYQMPISHYCEKVRWALDFKGVEWRGQNFLPGLHVKPARRIAPRSHLPILLDGDVVVQNSADIITYLDEKFPDRSLTPANLDLRSEALAWEAVADSDIGPHIRRVCYHVLLKYPAVTIPLLTAGGPWYGPFVLRLIYPKLVKTMRSAMKIDEENVNASLETLADAIQRLNVRLEGRRFLVGESLTRADLAAAALLAPIHRPDGYGLTWPKQPDELQQITSDLIGATPWVLGLYREFRRTRQ